MVTQKAAATAEGPLRKAVSATGSFISGLGVLITAGVVIAAIAIWIFGEIAEVVMRGNTQSFDESVLRWLGAHHTKVLDGAMIEITALGTGTVVIMIVAVAALFLFLTKHKYSGLLLLIATAGGLALNLVLKMRFDRPRPHVFMWGTNAVSSSFPSGHAMSATIVYSTVAYLAIRLYERTWPKIVTGVFAAIVIVAISASRLYLGVHYPSDVLAGAVIGLAWAAFCMATLEAVQKFTRKERPDLYFEEDEPVDL